MENLTIVSISYKFKERDEDKDICLQHISSIELQDKTRILVRMQNGNSFPVPAKVGLQLSTLWNKYAKTIVKITEEKMEFTKGEPTKVEE